jgi:hypothetical protein
MDVLAHAVYGATAFSRHGLAGGSLPRGGAPGRWYADRTIWAAALFGILPDVVSMWPSFAVHVVNGAEENYFRGVSDSTLTLYHYMHSFVIALPCCAIIAILRKPLFIPSLAWPLHVLMDAATHGTGKFQTRPFHPISDWGIEGINWWQYPAVFYGYWVALLIIWIALWTWRRRVALRR